MMRGLVSRQPIWKTAIVSVLALTLVIGLSLTILSLSTESTHAADIAKNNPKIKSAFNDGDITKAVKITELTAEGKQEAIDIAKADPRIKELLDMGTMISKVSPMFSYSMINVETGEIVEISDTFVKVVIRGVETNYVAYVNLSEGKVVKLIDTTTALKKEAASKNEALQEKLAAMVEKGELTQEQANEKLEAFQSEKGSKSAQK
jgi:hypothetical protein